MCIQSDEYFIHSCYFAVTKAAENYDNPGVPVPKVVSQGFFRRQLSQFSFLTDTIRIFL